MSCEGGELAELKVELLIQTGGEHQKQFLLIADTYDDLISVGFRCVWVF